MTTTSKSRATWRVRYSAKVTPAKPLPTIMILAPIGSSSSLGRNFHSFTLGMALFTRIRRCCSRGWGKSVHVLFLLRGSCVAIEQPSDKSKQNTDRYSRHQHTDDCLQRS